MRQSHRPATHATSHPTTRPHIPHGPTATPRGGQTRDSGPRDPAAAAWHAGGLHGATTPVMPQKPALLRLIGLPPRGERVAVPVAGHHAFLAMPGSYQRVGAF